MELVFIGPVLLPLTPEKIETSKPGRNKTADLINDGEINILHDRGLQTFTFSVLLPSNQSYPFQNYSLNGLEAKAFRTYFDELQLRKLPFPFIQVSYQGDSKRLQNISYTNVLCTIEEQTVLQDAANGQDYVISLNLKEYREYGNEQVKIANAGADGKVTYSVSKSSGKSSNAELNRLASEIVAKMGTAASLFKL